METKPRCGAGVWAGDQAQCTICEGGSGGLAAREGERYPVSRRRRHRGTEGTRDRHFQRAYLRFISIELRSAWRHARQQQGLGARGCSCRGLHRARLPATSQEGSGSRARARLSMARAPGPPCVCGARGRDILTMRRDTRGDALHGACGHMTVDNLSA